MVPDLCTDILDASLGRRTVHVGNNVIDFNAPFARLDVMDELESQLGESPCCKITALVMPYR